jgi:hypothetical protein
MKPGVYKVEYSPSVGREGEIKSKKKMEGEGSQREKEKGKEKKGKEKREGVKGKENGNRGGKRERK